MSILKPGYVLCEARNESSVGEFALRTDEPTLHLLGSFYMDHEEDGFCPIGSPIVAAKPIDEIPRTPCGRYIVKISDILWVGELGD